MLKTTISYTTHILFGLLAILIIGISVWYQFSVQQSVSDSNNISEDTIMDTVLPTPSPAPQKTETVKLLFGGDLMFDRNIRLRMQEQGVDHVLSQLKPFFFQHDTVIANLEGPITNNPSRSVGSVPGSTNNFFFTFDPAVAPLLFEHNIKVVNLGNNHITNFGTDGLVQTRKYLQAAGVAYLGNTGAEQLPGERIFIQQFGNHTVAFVNLNQFTAGGFETALLDTQTATQTADIVIVLPHWGEEYTPEPNAVIRQQAHQLIDAGADAIIGAHPHVIQSWEDYQGKRIYYSLGNFVFDQYFSPEVQRGLLVSMEILPDQTLRYQTHEVSLEKNGQTVLLQ